MPTIRTCYMGDMLFETKLGKHTLHIDVPPTMKGKDRGPTPPQLFIASLGSCVAALVAEFCEEHGIDATGLTVDVGFEKSDHPTRLTAIRVTIALPHGKCDDRCTSKAIQRVAKHCPVHETITTIDDIRFEIVSAVPDP
jgi:putative redox protein